MRAVIDPRLAGAQDPVGVLGADDPFAKGLGMPAPVTKRRSTWQVIEDQRTLVGRAAPDAWSRGWHMSAEQVLGYAGEGA